MNAAVYVYLASGALPEGNTVGPSHSADEDLFEDPVLVEWSAVSCRGWHSLFFVGLRNRGLERKEYFSNGRNLERTAQNTQDDIYMCIMETFF